MTYAEQSVVKAAQDALELISTERVTIDAIKLVIHHLNDIINITRYSDDINCLNNEAEQYALEQITTEQ